MDKKIASRVLAKLEATATDVESLVKAGKVNPKIASELIQNIDKFSDNLEVAAFGRQAFENRRAKVLQRDSDEPWMDTFQNPQAPIQTEPDEPYMHKAPGGYNSKDMPTYDSDISSSVTDRDEYNVRDQSEWADPTKPQPSWSKGSAGKSTRQGSKRWAP